MPSEYPAAFFPQQSSQGHNYSPVDDARFKSGIPGWVQIFADPSAIVLGLYDIFYDPSSVNLRGGSSDSLQTIIEEIAHTVQFLQVWASLRPNPYLLGKHGIDSTGYSSAQRQWEQHYAYYAAKGKYNTGDSYKNDIEKWAKNRTFDIMLELLRDPNIKKQGSYADSI